MNIAQLPHSNHINALRSFLNRIRRTRSIPSQQEFAHAEETLQALDTAMKTANTPSTNNQ